MMTVRDKARLTGVHPDLVAVVEAARQQVPFIVVEGIYANFGDVAPLDKVQELKEVRRRQSFLIFHISIDPLSPLPYSCLPLITSCVLLATGL